MKPFRVGILKQAFLFCRLMVFGIVFSLMTPALLAYAETPAPNIHNPVQAASSLPDVQAISGYWYTEDRDGIVELYACGTQVCGKFHWLQKDSPENPSLDERNPDPAMRVQPLCGLQFMGGFEPQGMRRFANGWIYSPRHGGKFSGSLTLTDNDTLSLRGFVFIPLLGDTQTWTRTGPEPACQTSNPVFQSDRKPGALNAS